MKNLLEKGEIFMNINKVFRNEKLNQQRYDKLEGALSNYYIKEGTLKLRNAGTKDEWKTLNIFNSHFNEFANTESIYSYSLYMMTLEDFKNSSLYQIDAKMSELGSHIVFIKQVETFLDKIRKYLESNCFEYCIQPIIYFDPHTTLKQLTLFHKSNSLSHQKELRIIVKTKNKEPLLFQIGNLKEIAEMFETSTLLNSEMKI